MESMSRFTEQDQERLFRLPAAELSAFSMRLAEITMQREIADKNWEKAMEKIEEDTKVLFTEIKNRLAIFEERGY